MRKIISVFQRNHETDRLCRDEVAPGAEWVLAGEGVATRKFDGACCMMKDGVFYRRYDSKNGKKPPTGFIPAQEPDPVTGHWPGWLEVGPEPSSKWFRVAYWNSAPEDPAPGECPPDGTYEAIGPHFQGNPEKADVDILIKHGMVEMAGCPRDFEGLRRYLEPLDIEGIVFHHQDGRMAKVKKKDFGLQRVRPEHGRRR